MKQTISRFEREIELIVDDLMECDQPACEIANQVVSRVNREMESLRKENEQLRLQSQAAIQDKQSIIASLSTQLKICMKELDVAERTIRHIRNEPCFNCEGKQQVLNTETGIHEICAICDGSGVAPL